MVRFGLLRPFFKSENNSKINLFRCVLWTDKWFIFKRPKTILLNDNDKDNFDLRTISLIILSGYNLQVQLNLINSSFWMFITKLKCVYLLRLKGLLIITLLVIQKPLPGENLSSDDIYSCLSTSVCLRWVSDFSEAVIRRFTAKSWWASQFQEGQTTNLTLITFFLKWRRKKTR